MNFSILFTQFMRVSLLCFLIALLTSQLLTAAFVKGQDIAATPVTIGLNNEPITSAIKKIEKQTTFRFYYRSSDTKTISPLDLPQAKRTVAQTLTELLKNTNFTFRQMDQNILIQKKPENQLPERKISGQVFQEHTTETVPYVLVELLRSRDSVLTGHGYTDTAGRFQITTTENTDLLLRVSGVGYEIYTSKLSAGNTGMTVPAVFLKPSVNVLKEVAITATQPTIQRKSDRFIVGIGNSSLSLSNNVWDVLKKVPLVNASEDGELSILGKQAAVVYINGRKTNLSGEALHNYLKSLPASNINNIEVITSPGSEFDASGNSGIINIISKKRVSDGYMGSVSLSNSQAHYNTQVYNGSLNYRKGKLGINFTPYLNRLHQFIPEENVTDFINLGAKGQSTSTVLERNELKKDYGESFEAEYNLTPKQTIIATANYSLQRQTLYSLSNSSFIDNATQRTDSGFVTTADRRVKGHALDMGLNYHLNLDTLGQDLILSADYFNYLNNSTQLLTSTLKGTDQIRQNELSVLPQKVKSYTFSADYKLPINTTTQVKAGIRSFNTSTNNNMYYGIANSADVYVKDILRSTNYDYQEHIQAVYANLEHSWGKKISMVAGLRLEQSKTNGKELTRNEVAVNKTYLNLFPNLNVSYNHDQDNQFSYSLSKRIKRPDFWELNTFRSYLSPTFYVEGNPFLQPTYILKNELTYTFKKKYIFLANYTHMTNAFAQFLLANDTDNTIRGVRLNFGTINYVSGAFIMNQRISNVLQSQLTAELYYITYKGQAADELIDNSGMTGSLKLNNTITLSKKKLWTAYADMSYRTPQAINYSGDSKIKASGYLDLGIKKVINQFTLSLSGSDLLKTTTTRFQVNTSRTTNTGKNYYDTRRIQFMVKYNFGNSKIRKNETRNNAASETINRAGK